MDFRWRRFRLDPWSLIYDRGTEPRRVGNSQKRAPGDFGSRHCRSRTPPTVLSTGSSAATPIWGPIHRCPADQRSSAPT